jgi:predicted nucleotidyltransferase
MAHGGEPRGHLTTGLAERCPPPLRPRLELLDAARRLDKHYIPARYPNGFAAGYPGKLHTRGEAQQAIDHATLIAMSAGASYLNRRQRIADLEPAAERARQRLSSIERIVLFGSLARGTAYPRSDADLLVILSASRHPESRDRLPDVLAALAPLPCPVDLLSRGLSRLETDASQQ